MLINAYATHRAPPPFPFHDQLRARRDRTAPELAEHLQGFAGYVMRGERPMTILRYALLRHLERVQHHLAFDVEEPQLNALAAWAFAANAILVLADGSVCAPDGRVLSATDTGEPEPGAEVPYPDDAVRRRVRTRAVLAQNGVGIPATLPPVIAEVEVDLRAPAAVVERCRALCACAVRAESLQVGEPIATEALDRQLPGAIAALSPRERAFWTDPAPPEATVRALGWRYEALAALAWACEIVPDLTYPSLTCDVERLAGAMRRLPATYDATARLRPAADLLDALDVIFCLHWALTEAQHNGGAEPPHIQAGVVIERHHALNWLVRFADAAWDVVPTPT